jgi:hypothetical protein
MDRLKPLLDKLNITADFPWGYVLYFVIAMCVLTLVLQKQSNLTITVLMAIAMMAALIEKIQALPPYEIWAHMTRIAMFVMPLVVAGMTRTGRSRGPAILAGLVAAIYMFARWAQTPK